MSRGFAWLDTGTHESLTEATEFVKAIEKQTIGLKIGCVEEVAYRMNHIDKATLVESAQNMGNSGYTKYLLKV